MVGIWLASVFWIFGLDNKMDNNLTNVIITLPIVTRVYISFYIMESVYEISKCQVLDFSKKILKQ